MSRFNSEYDFEYNNAYELWHANVVRHLKGERGQKVLRELRDALLGLPERKLIHGRLADEQGCVCTVGALALHRRETAGEARTQVLADLADIVKPGEYGYIDECEADERTLNIGQSIGLKIVMAVTLAFRNDDGPLTETDEERFERVLAWVESEIEPEQAHA